MKKLLYFAFLGVFAFFGCVTADTIDIKWGADNQTYTTTTCTVGGDVILPTPPTKRGYVFRGWQKDVFNRGRWLDWASVPSVSSEYPADYHGNHVPEQNDYMVVEDASGYVSGEDLWVSNIGWQYTTIRTADDSFNVPYGTVIDRKFCNDMIQIVTTSLTIHIYALGSVLYNNTRYDGTPENPIQMYYRYTDNSFGEQHFATITSAPLSGTWRFVYDGDWSTDGKKGWEPVEQIANE